MKKEEFIELYKQLGYTTIDDLYHYSCLLASGFDEEQSYKLISLLNDLWLKDENNYSISKLSDMLYEIYDDINDSMSTRQILTLMYENEDF